MGIPNAANTTVSEQPVLVGGGSLTSTVTNSNAVVGQLAVIGTTDQTVAVQLQEGQGRTPFNVASGGVAFDPLAAGAMIVGATIPGLLTTNKGTLSVNVSP